VSPEAAVVFEVILSLKDRFRDEEADDDAMHP
jgi:hypothetical protein